jgi:hypothetical protein
VFSECCGTRPALGPAVGGRCQDECVILAGVGDWGNGAAAARIGQRRLPGDFPRKWDVFQRPAGTGEDRSPVFTEANWRLAPDQPVRTTRSRPRPGFGAFLQLRKTPSEIIAPKNHRIEVRTNKKGPAATTRTVNRIAVHLRA